MEARYRGPAALAPEDEDPKPSFEDLKRQLKDHYHNRDFTVGKAEANKYGVVYFLLTLFLHYYVGGWYVLPAVYTGEWLWLWKWTLTLILVESIFNWFMCCRKYVNKVVKRPEDEGKANLMEQGWYYCAPCQMTAPPRAHHCRVCNACMLRHDHHCFFAAGCIGLFTNSYFVFLCIWLLISQVLALYWTSLYLMTNLQSWWNIVPLVALYNVLFGEQPWLNALTVVCFLLMFINIGMIAFFLFMEIMGVCCNQTFHEGSKGIKIYRLDSVAQNVRQTMGSYYWIRWLIPFPITYETDGYSYVSNKRSS